MNEFGLFKQIESAQNGDSEASYELIKSFTPLLRHYARLCPYEDAFEEFQIMLLEIIKNINLHSFSNKNNAIIIAYFRKSIFHKYLQLSKQETLHSQCIDYEDLSDFQKACYDQKCSTTDTHDLLFLSDVKRILTSTQFTIIWLHFFKGYTIQQIAQYLHISRQSVNTTKLAAIKKLRDNFM